MASKKEWKRKYRDEFEAHNDSMEWYSEIVDALDASLGDLADENDELRAAATEAYESGWMVRDDFADDDFDKGYQEGYSNGYSQAIEDATEVVAKL